MVNGTDAFTALGASLHNHWKVGVARKTLVSS
jgi:hypothetical protein